MEVKRHLPNQRINEEIIRENRIHLRWIKMKTTKLMEWRESSAKEDILAINVYIKKEGKTLATKHN